MFLQQKIKINNGAISFLYYAPRYVNIHVNQNYNIQKTKYAIRCSAATINFNFYITDSFTSASLNMQLATSRYKHRLCSFV